MKKIIGIMLATSALGGCVSMLTHIRYPDSDTQQNALAMALVMTCADKGLIPGEVAYTYGYAMSQLFSVAVYNKDLYEKTYQKVKTEAGADNEERIAQGCEKVASVLPERTASAVQRYNEISRARGTDLSNMSRQAASIGSAMPSTIPNYGPTYGKTPSGQVNFGMPANRPNHYLVETGRGQRFCTATASGYVYCD